MATLVPALFHRIAWRLLAKTRRIAAEYKRLHIDSWLPAKAHLSSSGGVRVREKLKLSLFVLKVCL
jgi:hypothetical protein